MENLWQDLRFGLRMMIKHPGMTLVAVLALALGIGANTAMFSVVNAVLIRPLPYPAPERLVMIWEDHQRRGGPAREWTSAANFFDWRKQSQSLEKAAALSGWAPTLTGSEEPEQLRGARVTHDMFAVLGVPPFLGRDFSEPEDQPGGDRVMILSYGLWQRRFGSDPSIIGKSLTLSGNAFTVVGVMPQGFRFPLIPNCEAWTLLQARPIERGNAVLRIIARLKEKTSLEQTQAELGTIARRLEQQYPEANTGAGISVVTLHEQLMGELKTPLWILLGSVGFVLLIACANVANLMLARAAARRREIGIRLALGAARGRLVRQFLTESVLLAGAGGILGLLLAGFGLNLLIAGIPEDLTGMVRIRIDGWVLGFTLLLSFLTGILFGLAPALQVTRPDMNESLKSGREGCLRHNRVRSGLVVAEVALSLMLLIGAGLLMKSFVLLQNVDLGFNPKNLLTFTLVIPRTGYPENNHVRSFLARSLERIRNYPGVVSASATSSLPLSGSGTDADFLIEGRPAPAPGQTPVAWYSSVAPAFHRVMEIRVLKGRAFMDEDREGSPRVVVINESAARRYWPNEDPIGKRIGGGDPSNPQWRQIVGIVANVKFFGLDREQPPAMYFPMDQVPSRNLIFTIRTSSEPLLLASALRKEVGALDKNLALANVAAMEELVSDSVARPRLILSLLGLFATVALVLAAVGIYGVMSYVVSQRTHEIGIRMALGARARDVLKLVLGRGMVLVLLGVGLGLGGAFGLTRLLSTLLFGVSPTDPVTFLGISLVLALVALLATYVPARRATRVDPTVALRYE